MKKDLEIEFIHPELKEGEIFFTNSNLTSFESMSWKTKRIGKVAFDGKGKQLTSSDWFPVFLKKEELISTNVELNQIRKEFRFHIADSSKS